MVRGLIIVSTWIAVVTALAAPQRVYGDAVPSLRGDVPPEVADTQADPVILEPIRPLFPASTGTIPRARDCGTVEVMMMSAGALFLLMINFTPNFTRPRRGT